MSYLLLWVLKTEATKKDRYRGFSAELKKKGRIIWIMILFQEKCGISIKS